MQLWFPQQPVAGVDSSKIDKHMHVQTIYDTITCPTTKLFKINITQSLIGKSLIVKGGYNKWTEEQTSTRWRFEARLRRTKANSPICARDIPTYTFGKIQACCLINKHKRSNEGTKCASVSVKSYQKWSFVAVSKSLDNHGNHEGFYNNHQ